MKKIIGFFITFVLLITLLPGQQTKAATVNKHYTVKVTKVDVREKASPKAKIVGSLKKGTTVFVYSTEAGGWSKIKYKNKAGYIASSGLKGKVVGTKTTPVIMKDIKFGMTYQQVKDRETRKLYDQSYDRLSTSYLSYYATKYEINNVFSYMFERNQLSMAFYDFNPLDDYYSTDELWNIYYGLQDELIREFGEDYYYIEPEYTGYIASKSVWKRDNYEVMLNVSNEDGINRVYISYHPLGFSGASQENKDKRLNHLLNEIKQYKQQMGK